MLFYGPLSSNSTRVARSLQAFVVDHRPTVATMYRNDKDYRYNGGEDTIPQISYLHRLYRSRPLFLFLLPLAWGFLPICAFLDLFIIRSEFISRPLQRLAYLCFPVPSDIHIDAWWDGESKGFAHFDQIKLVDVKDGFVGVIGV